MSVLLVCEDPVEAERVEQELAGAPESPFMCQRVASLDTAVEALRRSPHDVLLLDIPLPEQGALNTLLRAQSLAHRIPIVVLGGAADSELALRAVDGGIQDFLIRAQCGPETLARSLRFAAARHRILAELWRSREASRSQSYHDLLTGLTNRSAFVRRLQETLEFARRFGDRPVVMMVELDRFAEFQARLGPLLGARLLQELGRRLTWCVRRTDVVSRLGADRFAILLPNVRTSATLDAVAERIRAAFASPFQVGPWKAGITASIGAVCSPENGTTIETLLLNAETAVFEARSQGGDRFRRLAETRAAEATPPPALLFPSKRTAGAA